MIVNGLGSQGQALIEFLGVSAMAILLIAGASYVLFDEWHRAKCAYWVFEGTHRKLLSMQDTLDPLIQIEETDHGYLGVGKCGSKVEKVKLPKLESAVW